MKIINLTPHEIIIMNADRQCFSIPSSGKIRCKEENKVVGEIPHNKSFIPIKKKVLSHIPPENIPPEIDGVIYVVSFLAAKQLAKQCPGRKDIFIPGPVVRNEQGEVLYCDGLAIIEEEGVYVNPFY